MLRFGSVRLMYLVYFHLFYLVFSFIVFFFVPTKYVAIYKVPAFGYVYDSSINQVINPAQVIYSRYAFIDSYNFKANVNSACLKNFSRYGSVPTEFRASLEPNLSLITLEVSAANIEIAKACLHEYYKQVYTYNVEHYNLIRNRLEMDNKLHMKQIHEYEYILSAYAKRCLTAGNQRHNYKDDFCFSGYSSYITYRAKIGSERDAVRKIKTMLDTVQIPDRYDSGLVFVQSIGTSLQLAFLLAVLYLPLIMAFIRLTNFKSSK